MYGGQKVDDDQVARPVFETIHSSGKRAVRGTLTLHSTSFTLLGEEGEHKLTSLSVLPYRFCLDIGKESHLVSAPHHFSKSSSNSSAITSAVRIPTSRMPRE